MIKDFRRDLQEIYLSLRHLDLKLREDSSRYFKSEADNLHTLACCANASERIVLQFEKMFNDNKFLTEYIPS